MNEEERFWSKVNIKDQNECWEWNAALRAGYGVISINNKKISAHRYSYKIHNSDFDEKLLVCHTCDNKLCVNPNHLFLGTQSDNMKDAFNKNRMVVPKGIRFKKGNIPKNRLLNIDDVKKVKIIINNRRKNKEKLKLKQLSIDYNIPYCTIRDISANRQYKNINTSQP